MTLFFTGLLLGILLGWLTLGGFLNPAAGQFIAAAGRVVVRILAVVLLAAGTGFFVWGTVGARAQERIAFSLAGTRFFEGASEARAWGSGLLAAGALSLALSFVRAG